MSHRNSGSSQLNARIPAGLTHKCISITPVQAFRLIWLKSYRSIRLNVDIQLPKPRLGQKSVEVALAIAALADKELRDANFRNALDYYNASLLHCPPGIPEEERDGPCQPSDISQLYEKRSQVSLQLGKYQHCISDILQSLRYQYLLDQEYELFERQGLCCEQLNEFHKAGLSFKEALNLCQDKFAVIRLERKLSAVGKRKMCSSRMVDCHPLQWTSPPKLSYGSHKLRPNISVAISAEFTRKSDSWIAMRDIGPGDVLIVEEAYSHRVDFEKGLCDWCGRKCFLAVPCPDCSLVTYCSENCRQNAWENYHEWECQVLPYLVSVLDKDHLPLLQLHVRTLLKFLSELSVWCNEHSCSILAEATSDAKYPLTSSRLRELLSVHEPIEFSESVLDTMSRAQLDIGACWDRAEKLIVEKSPLADYAVFCLLRLLISETNKHIPSFSCAGGVSTWNVRTLIQLLNWGDLISAQDFSSHSPHVLAAFWVVRFLQPLPLFNELASDAALAQYVCQLLKAQYDGSAYFRWFFSACGCREHLRGIPFETSRKSAESYYLSWLRSSKEDAKSAGIAEELAKAAVKYVDSVKEAKDSMTSLYGEPSIENPSASDFNTLLGALLIHCQYLSHQLVSEIRFGSGVSKSSSRQANAKVFGNTMKTQYFKQSRTKKASPSVNANKNEKNEGEHRLSDCQIGFGVYPSVALIQRCSNFNVGAVYHGTTCVVRALRNIRKGERLKIAPIYQPDESTEPNEKKVFDLNWKTKQHNERRAQLERRVSQLKKTVAQKNKKIAQHDEKIARLDEEIARQQEEKTLLNGNISQSTTQSNETNTYQEDERHPSMNESSNQPKAKKVPQQEDKVCHPEESIHLNVNMTYTSVPLRNVRCDCNACMHQTTSQQGAQANEEERFEKRNLKVTKNKKKTDDIAAALASSVPGEKPPFACPKCHNAITELSPQKCGHCGRQIQSEWLDFWLNWSQFVNSSPDPMQLSADLDEVVVTDIANRFSEVDKLIADGYKCRQYRSFIRGLHNYYQASVAFPQE